MPYKRKKTVQNNGMKKGLKTKRKNKDLDQIDDDLQPENAKKLLNQDIDFDKPGSGQFYCVECSRHFIDEEARNKHRRTKVHKRRLKALEISPYTIEESERAAGHGSWVTPAKRKIETLTRETLEQDLEPKRMKIGSA
ncbi:zinc finger protein 593 [Microplitis mediator]|uniref:zinc finger protein 593 n=1 Tax=Microplitis mediator TaxID=375433 RepID=UPI00255740E5|nr:zinc finger protein 593 [Microplitis mediator]XP_057331268.1 zinc finger protein 593 [Microplitis mediator]